MGKKIISLSLSAIFVLLAAFFLQNEKMLEAADNMVLLEKRHPEYWEYLSHEKMIEVQTVPGFEKVNAEKIKAGNILRDFTVGSYSGVDISYIDGVMNFKGTATEDIWPGIIPYNFTLEPGTYFVSVGKNYPLENVNIYFEGFEGDKRYLLARLKTDHFFTISENSNVNNKYTVSIKKNTNVNFSICPVLYKVQEDDFSLTKDAAWTDVPENIGADDINIFKRALNQYSEYRREVIYFRNGEVKVFENYKELNAVFDDLGRLVVHEGKQ